MHNNIMAAGSRDRPPMLATGRYAQWQSRFLRPNGDALRKCILEGPYTPSTVIILIVPATDNSPAVPERTTLMKCGKLSKGYNKVNPSTFKMSRQTYFGSLENSPLTMKKQWSHITQVNELRAERIAKNANPLALVATDQPYQDPYYQAPKSHKSYAPTSKASLPTRSQATTRHNGKEIAKPITPPSESASEEDSDPEQAQKDKEMQKNLALITNYMAKIQEVPIADSGTNSEPLEQNDQNVVECDDERVALANLIANLKLDVDENKKIQKQLKKANVSLTQELNECKSILAETSRTLGESNSIRDSCLVALQNKQTEFERYKNLNDRTIDYEKLENKLNETLGLLAQKGIDIKDGLVKEKTKVITDLKLKEEKDIDKIISMEKQLKFLNEIIYKRSQSIQTIHMLAPKCPTFNGRPTFENPMYLKKAQSEIPCLYEIPHDQSDPANRLVLDREETLTLERESRSKLNKDLVKLYDYTKELVDQAWLKHSKDHFRALTAHDMEILIKTCLMPLALKTQNDSFVFVHELKQEMHADLKYVESLEKEIDELKSDKAEFSSMYDMLLQEYSLEKKHFSKRKSVPKTNVSEGLSKTVTAQNLPQTASQAVRNTNVIKLGMYRIDTTTTQTRAPQLAQTSRNTNPRVSTSTGVNHRTIVSRSQLKSN
ncbi:hypothetical protein Tco_0701631 [Tanacetum coccineum]